MYTTEEPPEMYLITADESGQLIRTKFVDYSKIEKVEAGDPGSAWSEWEPMNAREDWFELARRIRKSARP